MKHGLVIPLLLALAISSAGAGPGFDGEELHYSVNWPSGLSLGEGALHATRIQAPAAQAPAWEFRFTLDAAVPGAQVTDRIRSVSTLDYCSRELDKSLRHGKRAAQEKTTIDAPSGIATRITEEGGTSTLPAAGCAKDTLTFLYFLRSELAKGRVPPPQTVLFGAPYQVRLEYRGARMIPAGETTIEADRIQASVKGPASEFAFEVYFARDAARTPILFRAPLALGTFSMELTR